MTDWKDYINTSETCGTGVGLLDRKSIFLEGAWKDYDSEDPIPLVSSIERMDFVGAGALPGEYNIAWFTFENNKRLEVRTDIESFTYPFADINALSIVVILNNNVDGDVEFNVLSSIYYNGAYSFLFNFTGLSKESILVAVKSGISATYYYDGEELVPPTTTTYNIVDLISENGGLDLTNLTQQLFDIIYQEPPE